jgi:hypothetical protein
VEGLNIGGILLLYLSLIVFGIGTLAAIGLWIARFNRGALLTFASGQLLSALVAVFAALTFLDPQFARGDNILGMILLSSAILLLAGGGQFIAALRCPRTYGAALACGALSILLLSLSSQGDWIGMAGIKLRSSPDVALLLALGCFVISLLPQQRQTDPLLWTALGGLGLIAGLAVGDFLVATHCQQLCPPAFANVAPVRVEVRVFGLPVSEATGETPIPDAGPGAIRFLTLGQAILIYTLRIAFGAAGLFAALAVGARLVKQATDPVLRPPDIGERFPVVPSYSSEQIKRM